MAQESTLRLSSIQTAPNTACTGRWGFWRTSQAVFYASAFFRSDGFAVPAPAPVTQTVRRFFAQGYELMINKKEQGVIIMILFMLAACAKPLSVPVESSQTPTKSTPTLTTLPLATTLPTSTSLPSWLLNIELSEASQVPTCEKLLQLTPGVSTLQDIYNLLGYPERRRDFATGVVIGYPSNYNKFKNTILLNGTTGEIIVVGAVVQNDKGCPRFDELKKKFGEPQLATMYGNRHLWFFEDHNIADTEMVLQILPSGITLEQYQAQNGYVEESYAFTP